MRQRSNTTGYAQLLIRARVGQFTADDIQLLSSRLIEPLPQTVIHAFPTNAMVDAHNEHNAIHS